MTNILAKFGWNRTKRIGVETIVRKKKERKKELEMCALVKGTR